MSVTEKVKCIEGRNKTLSISRQCELLQLPRSFILQTQIVSCRRAWQPGTHESYRWRVSEAPFLWQPKDEGLFEPQRYSCKPQTDPTLDTFNGLESVASKPNTSRQRKGHKVYPYLLKKMSITEPDQVWCSDITYIRLAHGFVYLAAVMDWASRYVLSWEVSVTRDDDFCVNALKECLAQA